MEGDTKIHRLVCVAVLVLLSLCLVSLLLFPSDPVAEFTLVNLLGYWFYCVFRTYSSVLLEHRVIAGVWGFLVGATVSALFTYLYFVRNCPMQDCVPAVAFVAALYYTFLSGCLGVLLAMFLPSPPENLIRVVKRVFWLVLPLSLYATAMSLREGIHALQVQGVLLESYAQTLGGILSFVLPVIGYLALLIILVHQIARPKTRIPPSRYWLWQSGQLLATLVFFPMTIMIPWRTVLTYLPGFNNSVFTGQLEFQEFISLRWEWIQQRWQSSPQVITSRYGQIIVEGYDASQLMSPATLTLVTSSGHKRVLAQQVVYWAPRTLSPNSEWVIVSRSTAGLYVNELNGLIAVRLKDGYLVPLTTAPLVNPQWNGMQHLTGDYIPAERSQSRSTRFRIPLPNLLQQ